MTIFSMLLETTHSDAQVIYYYVILLNEWIFKFINLTQEKTLKNLEISF